MKSSTLRTAALAICATALGSVLLLPATLAQPADTAGQPAFQRDGLGGPRHGRGLHQRNPANLIARADSNADGQVSLEEFLAPQLARIDDRFTCLDSNNDGSLSLAEVTVPIDAQARARFDKLDSNDDGVINQHDSATRVAAQRARRLAQDCTEILSED